MAEDLKALPGFSRPTQAWAAAEAANEIAALRTDNERLVESVDAARAEATLRFEESRHWRQQAQVVDDGLCMAKERIAELEAALREAYPIVVVAAEGLDPAEVGYVSQGWSVMEKVRALLYPKPTAAVKEE